MNLVKCLYEPSEWFLILGTIRVVTRGIVSVPADVILCRVGDFLCFWGFGIPLNEDDKAIL